MFYFKNHSAGLCKEKLGNQELFASVSWNNCYTTGEKIPFLKNCYGIM